MGSHHQVAGKPAKSDRRFEHHRERQATRTALHVTDLEDVLDRPSVHNISTLMSDSQVETKTRRFRHWKQPFWKRRTQPHHDRTATMNHLGDREPRGRK
ncbi:MAG: hypothetical protein M3063_05900 [Actinomycetota bacterium]|nr:hypothetical protein [Actinomycetota bacterium]